MLVTFEDGTNEEYEDTELAGGAEGKIYRSLDGNSVIKLYTHPDPDKIDALNNRLDILIEEYNPTKEDDYWKEFFAWPEKRVTHPGVGYRMHFVAGLKTMDNYFFSRSYQALKPEERGWFIGRIACAIKIASAADRLSRMGLCYPDFSEKNILVDPFAGKAVLIDCDSLTVPGKLPATVEGTRFYQAPEIVSRQTTIPSVETDRHSLAVLLYYWLLRGHPLRGDKIFDIDDTDNDDLLRFGTEALYIEHPTDTSNRLSRQRIKSSHLGREIHKLFHEACVVGLHNPPKRPMPIAWVEGLLKTYDRIIPCACTNCDWRFFVAEAKRQLICPQCQTPLSNPVFLPFLYLYSERMLPLSKPFLITQNAHYIVGWPGKVLHTWHTQTHIMPIYSGVGTLPDASPQAEFKYDQQQQEWYLKNLNLTNLLFHVEGDPDDTWITCNMGESILLRRNTILRFSDDAQYNCALIDMVRVVQ